MIDDVITCPFCDETISDNKNEIWNHCDHLFSAEDDIIDWGEYNFIDTINDIIETYCSHEKFDSFEDMIKDLKIGEFISIDDSWDCYTIGSTLEVMSKEVVLISNRWDAGQPGCSGTMQYLFIENEKKVKWVFDEFKILYDRLMKFDKENDNIFG